MKRWIFQVRQLLQAAKGDIAVQHGSWRDAAGEVRVLEGNKEWKQARGSEAQAARVKEGEWITRRRGRSDEAWAAESQHDALRKRGKWYDGKDWIFKSDDNRLWKKTTSARGKDSWHVLDEMTKRWTKTE